MDAPCPGFTALFLFALARFLSRLTGAFHADSNFLVLLHFRAFVRELAHTSAHRLTLLFPARATFRFRKWHLLIPILSVAPTTAFPISGATLLARLLVSIFPNTPTRTILTWSAHFHLLNNFELLPENLWRTQ